MRAWRVLVIGVATLVFGQVGASAAPPAGVTAAGSATISQETHGPPDKLAGLIVKKENVAKTLAQETRALYVDRVGLYSLRDPNNLLEATLEIGRFRSLAPYASQDFQLSVVGHLGSTLPTVVRLGTTPVYITTSKGLTIAIWFHAGFMMSLSIRNSYTQPKTLLREALGINP